MLENMSEISQSFSFGNLVIPEKQKNNWDRALFLLPVVIGKHKISCGKGKKTSAC